MYYGGMVLMGAGLIMVMSAFPFVQQSVVSVGPISADVSLISATRIIVGVVITVLGYFGYQKGK